MDFTFIMFVLSCGFLLGSYFVYWHIENIITDRAISLMHDIESLFSGWRLLLKEDLDALNKSLEILRNDYGKVRECVIEEIKKHSATPTPRPSRKTPMKKISSDGGD